MPDLRLAALAAHRFGFGPRPGELRTIAGDPRGWVKAQLGPRRALPAQIAALPPAEDDLLAFGRWLVQRRLNGGNAARVEERAERQGITREELQRLSIEEDFVANFRQRVTRAVGARVEAAVTSDAPAHERLVHFWSNHFTVSTAKPGAIALPPSFEKDAIRPHVGGRFADMLAASTKHPGMIVYLDNWLSIGPNSVAAQRPNRARRLPGGGRPTGINENLAREIMELHTLGVNGGYTQSDVQTLAAIITGWTYERPRLRDLLNEQTATRDGAALFEFDENAHEPGPKTLLNRTYAQNGVAQGEAALGADLGQEGGRVLRLVDVVVVVVKPARAVVIDPAGDAGHDAVAQDLAVHPVPRGPRAEGSAAGVADIIDGQHAGHVGAVQEERDARERSLEPGARSEATQLLMEHRVEERHREPPPRVELLRHRRRPA